MASHFDAMRCCLLLHKIAGEGLSKVMQDSRLMVAPWTVKLRLT